MSIHILREFSRRWKQKCKVVKFVFDENVFIVKSDFNVCIYLLSVNNLMDNYSAPDLDDVKESVRQGVHKVAARLGSLASDVFNRT